MKLKDFFFVEAGVPHGPISSKQTPASSGSPESLDWADSDTKDHIMSTAHIEPPDAPRKEFSFQGQRFMVIEMMWHWELRWWDPQNDRWVPINDADGLERDMPGIKKAVNTAIEQAEEAREVGQ